MRHLVLVGLPGAGKSAVGRALAARLWIPVVDVDATIEAEGHSIAWWFAERGEAAFRAEEQRIVRAALAGPPVVLVPGGGWGAVPGAIPMAWQSAALVVYLEVAPATAASRLGPDHGRPLLGEGGGGEDAVSTVARLQVLAEARVPAYRTADLCINTNIRTVSQVVEAIMSAMPSGYLP